MSDIANENPAAELEVPAAVLPVSEVPAPKARKAKPEPVKPGYLRVRVLKAGDGKISTGEHVPGTGDLTYSRHDEFDLIRANAEALEARGYVETVD